MLDFLVLGRVFIADFWRCLGLISLSAGPFISLLSFKAFSALHVNPSRIFLYFQVRARRNHEDRPKPSSIGSELKTACCF
jgi:dolichyl-phosphate-mannose--protein O-mannosyl transferase